MSSTVISVENVSKAYRLGQIGGGTLKEDFARWMAKLRRKPDPLLKIGEEHLARKMGEQFWALDNVSFQVKQGEVLGIIGRNGAGKSTLLKILSQVTTPTSGQIKIKGRIASLLEVGTGFNPEMTGRENVFLNGAILGMTKAEIRRKFDEIVAFSGIEEFIDTPVKRYSSGMYVRLAFAVAAHLEPEILIVDEVLAVGDAEFQKKCLGKMQDISKNAGRTIFLVSHSMASVRELCTKVVLLQNGKLVPKENVDACISAYLHQSDDRVGKSISHLKISDSALHISSITVNESPSDAVFVKGETQELKIVFEGVLEKSRKIEMEAVISDNLGNRLGLFSPGHEKGYPNVVPSGPFTLEQTIRLPGRINKGEHYLSLYLTEPNVAFWAIAENCVKLSFEGSPTKTGRALEYNAGAGWIFLTNKER